MRVVPVLDVTWPAPPAEAEIERLLAILDDHRPTAVEPLPAGARVFFSRDDDRDQARERVATLKPDVTTRAVEVPDDDWAERSQAALGAIRVGRIVVAPPWATRPDIAALGGPPGTGTIIIKPAMGFGSGHHASTRLALDLLQQAPVAGSHVLDAGTGSGVLAIAASHLGAARAIGFDSDADAIDSARETLELNVEIRNVTLTVADLDTGAWAPADIVTANLTGALLTRSASRLAGLVRVGGVLILAGILAAEEQDVLRAYEPVTQVRRRAREDEWIGLMLERRAGVLPAPSSPDGTE